MNKLFEVKFGSTLYGTTTPDSDIDLKSLYIPDPKDIILGRYKKIINISRPKQKYERNKSDDVDVEVFSIDRFLHLLTEGQLVALDMFFAPEEYITYFTKDGKRIWNEIRENKNKLITKGIASFIGYAKMQAARYGIKGSRMDALKKVVTLLSSLPPHDRLSQHSFLINDLIKATQSLISLEKTPLIQIVMLPSVNYKPDSGMSDTLPHLEVCNRKVAFTSTVKHANSIFQKILDEYGSRATKAHLDGGKDWKALSHSVRVNNQAIELLNTGHITFPRPDRELLVNIKTGQVPYEEVADMIVRGLVDVVKAQETSSLPTTPDMEWIDNFVLKEYKRVIQ